MITDIAPATQFATTSNWRTAARGIAIWLALAHARGLACWRRFFDSRDCHFRLPQSAELESSNSAALTRHCWPDAVRRDRTDNARNGSTAGYISPTPTSPCFAISVRRCAAAREAAQQRQTTATPAERFNASAGCGVRINVRSRAGKQGKGGVSLPFPPGATLSSIGNWRHHRAPPNAPA